MSHILGGNFQSQVRFHCRGRYPYHPWALGVAGGTTPVDPPQVTSTQETLSCHMFILLSGGEGWRDEEVIEMSIAVELKLVDILRTPGGRPVVVHIVDLYLSHLVVTKLGLVLGVGLVLTMMNLIKLVTCIL